MDRIEKIRHWLKRFNLKDIILWFDAVASHPANQDYSLRISFATAIALSIDINKYEGQPFTRTKCINFFEQLSTLFGEFDSLEDFTGFNQLNLIPLFWKHKKYYFYYASFERPHEELINFSKIYLGDNSTDELLEKMFISSLEHQTKVLEIVSNLKESTQKTKKAYKVFIPSEYYFETIKDLFHTGNEFPQTNRITKELLADLLKSGFEDYDVYNGCTIRICDEIFYLPVSIHLQALYFFASANANIDSTTHNVKNELLKYTLNFFTVRSILDSIWDIESKTPINYFDFVYMHEEGNFFLFKIVSISGIASTYQETKSLINQIKSKSIIHYKYKNQNRVYGVPTVACNFTTFIVFPQLDLKSKSIHLEENTREYNIYLYSLVDIKQLFTELEIPDLMKFLIHIKELYSKNKMMMIMDALDILAFYLENNKFITKAGIPYMFMGFEPHQWSSYYDSKTFEKYQNPINEMMELRFGDFYNKIWKSGKYQFRYSNTATLTAGFVINFDEKLLMFSLPPGGYDLKSEEIRWSEFLVDFYSYYFGFLKTVLSDTLLKGLNVCDIRVIATPNTTIEDESTEKISFPDIPFTANCRFENNVAIINVIFDLSKLPDFFDIKNKRCEQIALSFLLKKMCQAIPELQSIPDSTIDGFVKKHLPEGEIRFCCHQMRVDNPYATLYYKPYLLDSHDISKIEKVVGKYLYDSNIMPGIYLHEKSKEILIKIFDFIYKFLTDEVKNYSQQVLHYTYRELECLGNALNRLNIQTSLDTNKVIDYDINQRYLEEHDKLTQTSINTKYLLAIIQKYKPNGHKPINKNNWSFLLCLSYHLCSVSYLLDLMQYSLRKYKLEISGTYEFRLVNDSDDLDFKGFMQKECENKINYHKDKFNVSDTKKSVDKDTEVFWRNLDGIFEDEYGFKIRDLFAVLYALSNYVDDEPPKIMPPHFITKDSICEYITGAITDCPSPKALKAIIDFLAIEPNVFDSKDTLVPTQLFRSNKRINICPLIKIDDNVILFGNQACLDSCKLWTSGISCGELPFKTDFEILNNFILKYRQSLDSDLEDEVAQIAIECLNKENIESRVKNFHNISKELPENPACGEIDLIAVNKNTKTFFLLDAKNRNRALTPFDIKSDFEIFLRGKKSYLSKMIKKERFVRDNFNLFLKHFKVESISGWTIKKAFVVNCNHQMSFCYKKVIDFVEINNLRPFLLKNHIP